ncbi:DsbA family protein [Paenibacillus motobuensis]|uniref:DsbA family protein n=1 Tax=Paenibacillus TaxID=44249 RepID=UPI00204170E2|nr:MULTISPECIES: DsbA family protein [Paenibacillus]MCM3038347.1 DsbA family protein [Paenibacillus lutimineralis]MCM3645451.1 DsbA family protein [Paenibacillus motobuensis]
MRNKKWGLWALIGVAVLLVAVLVFIRVNEKNSQKAEFPDLEQVEAGQVPDRFDEANQPYMGNPEAAVKIVEFADYKCPACKQWTQEIFPKIKSEYLDTGKAVYYYVDFPFLAPDSTLAALAGETLYQQDQEYFWAYYDLMMENQGNKETAWANKKFIMNLIKENISGVDMKKFEQDLDDRKYIANIKRDLLIGEKQGVDGTPFVFVNGQAVDDISWEGMQAAIGQ